MLSNVLWVLAVFADADAAIVMSGLIRPV